MSFEAASNLILTWLSILSIIGAGGAFLLRRYIKSFERRYERALYSAEQDIKRLKNRYRSIFEFAQRLISDMTKAGLNPPPIPFIYDDWNDHDESATGPEYDTIDLTRIRRGKRPRK